MNVKLLLVLTIVLSSLFVLPVSAYDVYCDLNAGNAQSIDAGEIQNLRVYLNNVPIGGLVDIIYYVNNVNKGTLPMPQPNVFYADIPLDYSENSLYIYFECITQTGRKYAGITVYYSEPSESGDNDFTIDIDLQEQTFELGTINELDKSFSIGSSSDRVVKTYTFQSSQNCYIFDLQKNYVNVAFNKNNNQASIYLAGTAQKETVISEFTTTVYFNYTYEEKEKIDFEIESIDYDKGIQLIGANITVYYYHELDDLLERVYYNDYSNGLTRIELFNNTDIFIEFELNGYNAVNGQNYDYLQNKYGILTNTKFKSQRLYFTKIDPSVLLFQGFIIKDSNLNALTGVSVTMDNNATLISNGYGGVRFDNINQGSHTFTFSKSGFYSQSLTKTVAMSNTQDIMLISSIAQPTTQPTVKPTPYPTDPQGNIIIEKPSNLADSIKYGLAKIFGVNSVESINLIFALMLILFPAVVAGVITNQALAFVAGGMIGFVFCLAIGLIPIWVFFSMVMLTVIYLILSNKSEGF